MFKKYRLYREYKKFIKSNSDLLYREFRLKIDYTNYLYTIVNLDEETVDKYYTENDKIAKPFIKNYIKKVDQFFTMNNMSELIAIKNVKRIDDLNYKVEFCFSLFDSKKRANRIALIFTLISLTTLSYFLFF